MTRFKRRLLASLVLPAMCVTGSAYAQSTTSDNASASRASGNTATGAGGSSWSGNDMDRLWNALDTNHDGVISRAEFDAGRRGQLHSMRPLSDTQTGGRNAGGNNGALAHIGNIRVTNLIGTNVRNPQGEDLGEIKDLLVDVHDGRVRYAVLDYGGAAGKLFSVPITAFRPSANGQQLVVNIDNSRLENSPGFDAEQWPDFNRSGYTGAVDRYFGNGKRAQGVSSANASQAPNGGAGALQRASRLIGRDVNDRQGEDIGQIDDLVVDMRNGNIRYAVLQYDKPSSTDNEMWAVPMNALDFVKGRNIKLNVSRAQLETGPSFGSEQVRDFNGRPVAIERYWLVVVPGDVDATSGNGGNGSSTNGSNTSGSSAYNSASHTNGSPAYDSANGVGANASSAQDDATETNLGNTSANGATSAAASTSTGDNRTTTGSSSTTDASGTPSGSNGTTGHGSDASAGSAPSSAQFDRLDTNRDDNLNPGELTQDPAEASKFQELDKNHNGSISRDEFTPQRRLPAARNGGSTSQ